MAIIRITDQLLFDIIGHGLRLPVTIQQIETNPTNNSEYVLQVPFPGMADDEEISAIYTGKGFADPNLEVQFIRKHPYVTPS